MLKILEAILAILGMLLGFLMFLVMVFKDSLIDYLDAKTEEVRARARKEVQYDEE